MAIICMKEHGDDVKRMCSEEGQTLFWASNFSIGVAIFSAVNKYLAKIMNQFPQYDVEMEETHHVHKLDHPSGTAITLAEGIVENIDRKVAWAEDTTDPKLLRIDHIRRGEVAGIHTVRYDSETSLRLPTMPIRVRALPLVPYWLLSTPKTIKDC